MSADSKTEVVIASTTRKRSRSPEAACSDPATKKRESWYRKFIPVLPGNANKTWPPGDNQPVTYRYDGKEFRMVPQPASEFIIAVYVEGGSYRPWRVVPTDSPPMTQHLVAKSDEEVVLYLDGLAGLEVAVLRHELIDKVIDESDAALWTLFVARQCSLMKKSADLPNSERVVVASEFLQSDPKLCGVARELLSSWRSNENKTLDDHGHAGRVIVRNEITLNRWEEKIMESTPWRGKSYSEDNDSVVYGTPMMKIHRREHDSKYSRGDDAWISVYKGCGNPYYIGKDGKVHLSTWSTGVTIPETSVLTTGCMKIRGSENLVMRYTSITVDELETILKDL